MNIQNTKAHPDVIPTLLRPHTHRVSFTSNVSFEDKLSYDGEISEDDEQDSVWSVSSNKRYKKTPKQGELRPNSMPIYLMNKSSSVYKPENLKRFQYCRSSSEGGDRPIRQELNQVANVTHEHQVANVSQKNQAVNVTHEHQVANLTHEHPDLDNVSEYITIESSNSTQEPNFVFSDVGLSHFKTPSAFQIDTDFLKQSTSNISLNRKDLSTLPGHKALLNEPHSPSSLDKTSRPRLSSDTNIHSHRSRYKAEKDLVEGQKEPVRTIPRQSGKRSFWKKELRGVWEEENQRKLKDENSNSDSKPEEKKTSLPTHKKAVQIFNSVNPFGKRKLRLSSPKRSSTKTKLLDKFEDDEENLLSKVDSEELNILSYFEKEGSLSSEIDTDSETRLQVSDNAETAVKNLTRFAIKEELKCKIQLRRLKTGRDFLTKEDLYSEQRTNNFGEEDIARREETKERNRFHAKKSREKKKNEFKEVRETHISLLEEREQLRHDISTLQQKKKLYERRIQQHNEREGISSNDLIITIPPREDDKDMFEYIFENQDEKLPDINQTFSVGESMEFVFPESLFENSNANANSTGNEITFLSVHGNESVEKQKVLSPTEAFSHMSLSSAFSSQTCTKEQFESLDVKEIEPSIQFIDQDVDISESSNDFKIEIETQSSESSSSSFDLQKYIEI